MLTIYQEISISPCSVRDYYLFCFSNYPVLEGKTDPVGGGGMAPVGEGRIQEKGEYGRNIMYSCM
jgi:hypothetical protein